jgi:hypothetical protein
MLTMNEPLSQMPQTLTDMTASVIENQATHRYVVRNAMVDAPSPRAAYEFVRAAKMRDDVVAAAAGIFDGQLYIWLFLDDIDVSATRALFDLRAAVEQSEQGTFELHVDALQGRSVVDALPGNFQLLSF